MQAAIGYVKVPTLQAQLDLDWGAGTFTVEVEDLGEIKNFTLVWGAGVPQNAVDGATAAAAANAGSYLDSIKIELYSRLAAKAEKVLASRPAPTYSQEDVDEAAAWLSGGGDPPACVQFAALANGLTLNAAAQLVVDSVASYNIWTAEVNGYRSSGQSAVMAAQDVYAAKAAALAAMDGMKSA